MSKKNDERQLTETSALAEEFAKERKGQWAYLVLVLGSTIVVSTCALSALNCLRSMV
jgi:hypothetical protein